MSALSARIGRLLVVAGAVALLGACAQSAPPPAFPPAEVNTLEIHPGAMQLSLEHAAQLRGIREIEVRAQVSGILLKKAYRDGARVHANDLLFRIDPATFRRRCGPRASGSGGPAGESVAGAPRT